MESSVLVAVATCLLVVLLIKWVFGSDKKSPPGPWNFPIIGYIPFLSRKPYLDFMKLTKRYGSIYSLKLGSRKIIVLNDFKSMKDAFSRDVLMGRPDEQVFVLNQKTTDTRAFIDLPWKEQRRFSLHMLRDLGLGKSKMEGQLQEEIADLLQHYEKTLGKPILIRDLLSPSMSNNIATLVFGKRMKYDDPDRKMLTKALNEIGAAVGTVTWMLFFPWLKNICRILNIGDVDKLQRVSVKFREYTWNEITKHEATLNPNNIRDYIDGYLLEIQKRKNEPAFCKEVLQDLVGGFFGAGSETVRITVEWLLLTAAAHQEKQRKVQAEIDSVVGSNRLPQGPDRKLMPYSEAYISELMRWRTIIPLNFIRCALDDTQIGDYFIPKDSWILANIWSVHHDSDYWGSDVEEFCPERFLTEDGKAVKKFEHFMPFSTGKRACPGEPLALVEVFLYFTSILQKFNVRLPEGKVADYEGQLGIGLSPKPQEVILTIRS